jgi:hypothetical protein
MIHAQSERSAETLPLHASRLQWIPIPSDYSHWTRHFRCGVTCGVSVSCAKHHGLGQWRKGAQSCESTALWNFLGRHICHCLPLRPRMTSKCIKDLHPKCLSTLPASLFSLFPSLRYTDDLFSTSCCMQDQCLKYSPEYKFYPSANGNFASATTLLAQIIDNSPFFLRSLAADCNLCRSHNWLSDL